MSFSGSGGASNSKSQQSSQTFFDPKQQALADNNYINLSTQVNNPNSPLSYKPYSGPGLDFGDSAPLQHLTNYSAPAVGADTVNSLTSAFMNPFTQNVVDTTNADLSRDQAIAGVGADSQATAAGAFGGSRSAVLRNLSDDSYIRAKAATDASLRQSGFQGAQGAALQTAQGNQSADLNAANTRLQALGISSNQAQAIFGANWAQYVNSQQDPQQLQALVNQSLGLTPQQALGSSQGTSNASAFNFGISGGAK